MVSVLIPAPWRRPLAGSTEDKEEEEAALSVLLPPRVRLPSM
jgi:hypothetical protein